MLCLCYSHLSSLDVLLIIIMAEHSPLNVASSGRTTPVNTTPPPEAQHAAKSTPIMRKTAGFTKHSSIEEKKMELRYTELAREICGHYIGPMPVQSFLDDFLPWNKETRRRLEMLKSLQSVSIGSNVWQSLLRKSCISNMCMEVITAGLLTDIA